MRPRRPGRRGTHAFMVLVHHGDRQAQRRSQTRRETQDLGEGGGTMRAQSGISRRHVLRMAMAVGGLAIAGGVRRVWAQEAKRIEQLAPELAQILSPSEPIQELADGFGGPQGPAEGPVWW